MKKIMNYAFSVYWERLKVLFLIMRLFSLLMLVGTLTLSAKSWSQQTKIDLQIQNSSVSDILLSIENGSRYLFIYDADMINALEKKSIDVEGKNIEEVLDRLFKYTNVAYRITDRQIFLYEKNALSTGLFSEQGQVDVMGRITDSSGAPLPGVTVIVKGTTTGIITDMDGKYSLAKVPYDATLVFSFVGMKTQELAVSGKSEINVTMAEEAMGIEEVVAVGYGTQKKINLTGAVSAVSGDVIETRQVGQTSMALQGVLPGVTVTQRSGQPGKDGGTIRIRGIGTLNDSNPLILIDGIAGDINNVDPNIIESISVLKDAASAAIYGSRAANGVILITTKRAKENVFKVNYSHYSEWQEPTDLINKINAQDYMSFVNTGLTNAGATPVYDEDMVNNYATLHASDPLQYPDTDWNKEIYTRNGYTQNHFLTLSGGTEKIRILGSFGYYDQKGIINNTDFKRYTLRLNSDIKFSEKFTSNIDVFLRQMNRTEPGVGAPEVINWGLMLAANVASYYPGIGYAYGLGKNPLADMNGGGYQKTTTPSVKLNLGFKYCFTDWLNIKFNYAPDFSQSNNKKYLIPVNLYNLDGAVGVVSPSVGSLTHTFNNNIQNTLVSTLNFDKSFNDHHLTFVGGYSQEDYTNWSLEGYRDNFVFPDYDVISAGSASNQRTSGSGSEWAIRSYFGRLNYNYKERYLFEANIRYDGSSRFATGHKYGTFPSISAGWRISEEKFWVPVKSIVDNLKLRASWGQLGNQNIGTYPFVSNLAGGSYTRGGSVYDAYWVGAMANTDITWESTEMTDIGVDFTLFNKLSVTYDYYDKTTDGILLRLDVPKTTGLSAPYQNAGVVSNKGWDLGITYSDWKGELKYNFSFVLSDVKNKIIDLHGIQNSGLTVNFEGYPIGSIYGYEAIGYFQDQAEIDNSPTQFGTLIPGSIKYKNQNDDNVINSNDRKIIGSTVPRYTFSLNSSFNWKNFDLSFLLQGVGKADGYLSGSTIQPLVNGNSALERAKDYWTPTNTDAKYPSLYYNGNNDKQNSTFWMLDAAYVRLKNLQFGYTLPGKLTSKIGVEKIHAYVNGQNLFTLDNFLDGYDVEAPIGGGEYYPQVKTYSIGVNITF